MKIFCNLQSKLTDFLDGGPIPSKNGNIKPFIVDIDCLGTKSKKRVLFRDHNCNFSTYIHTIIVAKSSHFSSS